MNKAAKIILINKDNQLLMQLRDNIPTISHPNSWSFIGGGIEEGESPEEALKREIKEEIPGCDIKNIAFLDKLYTPDTKFKNYCFIGEINEAIDKIKFTEGQKLGYFSLNELKNLKMNPALKQFIYDNQKRIFNTIGNSL